MHPVKWDPERSELAGEESQLAEDAIEEVELAEVAESVNEHLGFNKDGSSAAGEAHPHSPDQKDQLDQLWDKEN